jgi:hypothetical protein
MAEPKSEGVKIVMNGFKNLSAAERKEFIEVINAYLKAGVPEKRTLEESFTKAVASTGPLGGNICKCCGR